jgi:ubiquitin-protein ligase
MRRVMRELNDLKKSPPEGIRVQTSEEDMLDVTGIIEGPGGFFFSLVWRATHTPMTRWLTKG